MPREKRPEALEAHRLHHEEGFTVKDACEEIGINKATYYNYVNECEACRKKRERLRGDPDASLSFRGTPEIIEEGSTGVDEKVEVVLEQDESKRYGAEPSAGLGDPYGDSIRFTCSGCGEHVFLLYFEEDFWWHHASVTGLHNCVVDRVQFLDGFSKWLNYRGASLQDWGIDEDSLELDLK